MIPARYYPAAAGLEPVVAVDTVTVETGLGLLAVVPWPDDYDPLVANDPATFARALRYRPGWAFDFDAIRWAVIVTADLPDSRRQGGHAGLYAAVPLDRCPTLAAACRQVLLAIRNLEDHERVEWFRVNGRLVCDPHDSASWATPEERLGPIDP